MIKAKLKDNGEIDSLAKALLKLRTEKEIVAFLKDVFTMNELENIILRWKVAQFLHQGKSYLEIARLTGASSATIAKVSEYLKYGHDGYKLILDRLDKKIR